MALGTVSLTSDWIQGDDSKHDSHYNAYNWTIVLIGYESSINSLVRLFYWYFSLPIKLSLILHFDQMIRFGDNCIQNFHFGRHISLEFCFKEMHGRAVKCDF